MQTIISAIASKCRCMAAVNNCLVPDYKWPTKEIMKPFFPKNKLSKQTHPVNDFYVNGSVQSLDKFR